MSSRKGSTWQLVLSRVSLAIVHWRRILGPRKACRNRQVAMRDIVVAKSARLARELAISFAPGGGVLVACRWTKNRMQQSGCKPCFDTHNVHAAMTTCLLVRGAVYSCATALSAPTHCSSADQHFAQSHLLWAQQELPNYIDCRKDLSVRCGPPGETVRDKQRSRR